MFRPRPRLARAQPRSTELSTPLLALGLLIGGCTARKVPPSLPSAGESMALGSPGPNMTRLVVGSCAKQTKEHPFWAPIMATKADGLLLLGDNVYGDGSADAPSGPSLPELRKAYRTLGEKPAYQAARQAMPFYTVWDDHDFGLNDQGGTFAHKEMAKAIFLDFWGAPPDDVRRTRPGIHRSWTLDHQVPGGEARTVQLIALDTRSFRDDLRTGIFGRHYLPHTDSSTTMLGEAQWAWLEETLAEPADVRILMSSIQLFDRSHVWERWDTMPHERARLMGLLQASGRVVIVSGDRHLGGIYREGDLYELTSSGLTQSLTRYTSGRREPDVDPLRVGPAVVETNWGVIDLDWTANTIRLSLHDAEDGHTLQMVELSLL